MSAAPGRDDEALEAWLRARGLPLPDPAARERVRRAFVGGSAAGAGESGSRSAPGLRKGSVPDLEAFLRERAALPRPRDEFRARARRTFLGEAAGGERVAPALPAREGARRPWLLPSLAGLAAALVLLVLVPRLTGGAPGWRVVGMQGSTTVAFGAGAAAAAREGRLELGPQVLAVAGGSLHLVYADRFRVEALPGTRLSVEPGADGHLRLERGELFLQTLAGYPGSGLAVDTPEAHVAVTGTTLGVRADGVGTCVCVCEGHVALHERQSGADVVVSPESSHLVFADASMMSKDMPFPAGVAPLGDDEHEHVDRLRAFRATRW